jgi:hypothetical protein
VLTGYGCHPAGRTGGPPAPEVSVSHTFIHFLHDAGAAAWFGGSLMGATSLNAAASELDDPRMRARASTAGWSRWAPVNTAAVAAHLIGGTGLLLTDSHRVATQEGVGRSTALKTLATGAALGTAVWSAALNRKMAAAGDVPVRGATEPGPGTPPDVARTQSQLKLNQWINPLVSGAIIVLGAWHEEQQRTTQVVPGVVKGVAGRPSILLPALAATAVGVIASRRSGRSGSASTTAYPTTAVTTTPTATGTTTGTTTTASAGTSADGTSAAPLGTSGPTGPTGPTTAS